MQNSGPLVFLGIAILVLTAIVIIVPYMRGKSDILTAWNMLWLGGAVFTGIGSLAVHYGNFHWPELQWFQPTRSDVNSYIIGSIVFYGTMLFAYYRLSWTKRLVAGRFNKWPPMSLSLLMCVLTLLAVCSVGTYLAQGAFFLGPLLFNVVQKVLIFAVVFTCCYWYEDKWNVPKLILFLAVFGFALLDSMVLFHGRRLLLSAAVAPIICVYWLQWRNFPPRRNLILIGGATFLIFAVAAVYSTFRHFSSRDGGEANRSFAATIQAMKTTSADSALNAVTSNPYYYLSQYCVHYSLLTIQLLDKGQLQKEPLNTLAFLATYPIPRQIFPIKPAPLGRRMVSEVLRLPYSTNWGLGIVAYGYFEGGLPVIMLYALLIVLVVRLLDNALTRHPTNPFLLGILSSTAPHFVALIRGDPTNMSAEILEAFVFAWGLALIARFFFGTVPYSATHEVPRQWSSPFQNQFRSR